ncbi:hypothetical protein [Niallia sp. FSL W8-0635]|uniref:hypothetical protein n=1 Tax=Niallia sp. FSL W8-0635 TaxID=2975337 RepID=UPI0030F98FDD
MLKVVFVSFTNNMQKKMIFVAMDLMEDICLSRTYETLLQSEVIGSKKKSVGALPH